MRDAPARLAPVDYAPRASKRVRRPCPCGCGEMGLCEPHRARLGEIRERIEEGVKARGRYAQRSDQRKYRKGDGTGRGGTCCNPDCWNSRLPGERYCDNCQAEGWSEDDIG